MSSEYTQRLYKRELIGLAGFRRISVPIRLRRKIISSRKKKIPKVKDYKFMDFLHKMIFPVRRVWIALSSRLKPRKNGDGLLKLQDDVQTCGYEDVQVMWEMLRRTETSEVLEKRKQQQPFRRIFVWSSNHTDDASLEESSKS